jgi:SAM-dependent methyltransferase
MSRIKNYAIDSQRLFGALSHLTDCEWLELVLKSIHDPSYVGLALPQVAREDIQRKYNGIIDCQANLRFGFQFYRIVKSYLERLRQTLSPETCVLDFGCGWGRMIRFFLKDVLGDNLFGIDVDPVAIDTCNQTMTYRTYCLTQTCPPTAFPPNSSNVIYAYSVFSHLSESVHMKWIEEFGRILKPEGVFFATTLGRAFIDVCKSFREKGTLEQSWQQSAAASFLDPEAALADYLSGKYLFAPNPWPDYGMALIPRAYVEREWTRDFELADFIDDREFLPQALIVMKKRLVARP